MGGGGRIYFIAAIGSLNILALNMCDLCCF